MFERQTETTLTGAAFRLSDLIFQNAVRSVRKTHANAVLAILSSILQTLVLVGVFYGFAIMIPGMRGMAIRGDFLLYIMTGIFMYMVHIKALAAVAGAENAGSAMMQHMPMNTVVSVAAAALGALYVQVVSLFAVLFVYHIAFQPVSIDQPVKAMGVLVLAWALGVAIGLVVFAAKPWFPGPVGIVQQFYARINMFASGKMFVANQLPAHIVALFAWNPLFHIIDQVRGFVFINYTPLKSELAYPIICAVAILTLGCLGASYTQRYISASWTAGR